jgi:hypothetical protein
MSFAKRQITLQFSGADIGTINLEGLRCQAIINNPGGTNAFGNLQLKVWGMTLEQMNEYSKAGSNLVAGVNYFVTVMAGNEGSPLTQVFSGHIVNSYIDFSNIPEVSFVCVASSGYLEKITSAPPNSYQGAQNAEDIIGALTTQLGSNWSFKNNNAHAIITNQYLSGSLIDQIKTVAKAAAFPFKIENNTVYIWSNDGNVDNVIVDVSPQNGLVGYPVYWAQGFYIKTEFNQLISNGRKINLTSSIPKANGLWDAHVITHEISTLIPDGPWFSNARLNQHSNSQGSYYVPAN